MVSQWHNWQSYYFRQMSLANSHQDIQAEIIIPYFFEPQMLPSTFFSLCFPVVFWFYCFSAYWVDGVPYITRVLTSYKGIEKVLSTKKTRLDLPGNCTRLFFHTRRQRAQIKIYLNMYLIQILHLIQHIYPIDTPFIFLTVYQTAATTLLMLCKWRESDDTT